MHTRQLPFPPSPPHLREAQLPRAVGHAGNHAATPAGGGARGCSSLTQAHWSLRGCSPHRNPATHPSVTEK